MSDITAKSIQWTVNTSYESATIFFEVKISSDFSSRRALSKSPSPFVYLKIAVTPPSRPFLNLPNSIIPLKTFLVLKLAFYAGLRERLVKCPGQVL